MDDPVPGSSESRTTLRSGKKPELHPILKERPYMKKTAQKPSTRSSTSCWLLGEPSTLQFWSDQVDSSGKAMTAFPDMTGKQLPSLMEVMRNMASLRQALPRVSVYDLAVQTCDVVTVYWRMAKIPIQELSDSKKKTYCAANRLSQLWQEYQTLKKHKNRNTEAEIQNRADMTYRLSLLFNMDHPKAKEIIMADTTRTEIDKQRDIEFLDDQKFERKMVMGTEDKVYKKRYQRKLNKLQREEDRAAKWKEEQAKHTLKRTLVSEDIVDDEKDEDFSPMERKKAKSKFCPVLLPRKILEGDHVNQMADRNATSYRQEVGNVAAVLQDAKALDGSPLDIKQFALSKNTAYRSRYKAREEFTDNFYKTFSAPKYTACHWDEKYCKKVLGRDFGQGHIAVLLSGERYEEGLLVDVSGLPNGEGSTLANVCFEAISRCRCQENIKILVFDTTASNSGIHKGAAAILERDKLCHKIIWGGCRKHVAELLVKPVHKLIFGDSKSPIYTDFKDFQSIWLKVPTEDDPEFLNRKAAGVQMVFLTDWEIKRAKEVAMELTRLLTTRGKNDLLPRDDYRELLELAFLVNPFAAPVKHTIKKPGGHNKARWMCVCIYCLKMFWFQNQSILGYSAEFKDSLQRFVKFLLLIYVPYWFKVTLSSDAAVHDLNLYKHLLQYNNIDSESSQAALRAQSRHYWYLAPESVILWCLFGDELEQDQKGRLAATLLTKPRPDTWTPKKVKFPILTPNTSLVSLITTMSWFPFYLLDLSSKWLELPPSQWELDSDFLAMKKFARTVKLVNDVAERGVKLANDYCDCLTTNSEERKKLIMVVQNHRRSYPKLRKMDLVKRIGKQDENLLIANDDEEASDDNDGTVEDLEVIEFSDTESNESDSEY